MSIDARGPIALMTEYAQTIVEETIYCGHDTVKLVAVNRTVVEKHLTVTANIDGRIVGETAIILPALSYVKLPTIEVPANGKLTVRFDDNPWAMPDYSNHEYPDGLVGLAEAPYAKAAECYEAMMPVEWTFDVVKF